MMGKHGFDCRMLNTEGGRIVHNTLEECIKNDTTELKIEGSQKKTEELKDGYHFELTDKWIGYAGVVVLSEALKTNTTLSKLTLGG